MSLSLRCPSCKKVLNINNQLAGKRVKCSSCGQVMLLRPVDPAGQAKRSAPPPMRRANRRPWYIGSGVAVAVCLLAGVAVLLARTAKGDLDSTSTVVEGRLPETAPAAASRPASKAEIQADPKAESKSEPTPKAVVKSVPQPGPNRKPEPKPAPGLEPKSATGSERKQRPIPDLNPEASRRPKIEAQPVQEKPRVYDTSRLSFPKEPNRTLNFADAKTIAFSPDGKRLVAAGANAARESVITAWNTALWEKEREVHLCCKAAQVQFTSDGRSLVVSGESDSKIWLLDPLTFQVRDTLRAPGTVIAFALSPDGKTMATISSNDWKIQLWDLANQKVARVLSGQAELATCLAYSPDGKYLASTGKRVRLWNLASGGVERTLGRDEDSFACFVASFAPDSSKLAGSCNDRNTRIWDVASGRLLESFVGDQENVFAVRFSPDGHTLLTRSIKAFNRSDRTSVFLAVATGSDVCIWNVAAGSVHTLCNSVCVMEPHSFAFSPNGQTIAAKINKGVGVWIGNVVQGVGANPPSRQVAEPPTPRPGAREPGSSPALTKPPASARTTTAGELVVDIKTKLGIEQTVTVKAVQPAYPDRPKFNRTVGIKALQNMSALVTRIGGDRRLCVDLGGGAILLLPWSAVKEVSQKKDKQVVSLTDGTTLADVTLLTQIRSKGDDKEFNLGAVRSLVVKSAPAESSAAKGKKIWSMKVNDCGREFEVRSPSFIWRQGFADEFPALFKFDNDHFTLEIGKERLDGNLSDFEFISMERNSTIDFKEYFKWNGKGRFTLKAPKGEEITGMAYGFRVLPLESRELWALSVQSTDGFIFMFGVPWEGESFKMSMRHKNK